MTNEIEHIDRHYMKVQSQLRESGIRYADLESADSPESDPSGNKMDSSNLQASLRESRHAVDRLEKELHDSEHRLVEVVSENATARAREEQLRIHMELLERSAASTRRENEQMRLQMADLLSAHKMVRLQLDEKQTEVAELELVVSALEEQVCEETRVARDAQSKIAEMMQIVKAERPLSAKPTEDKAMQTEQLQTSIVDALLARLQSSGYLSYQPFDRDIQSCIDRVERVDDYQLVHALRRMRLTSWQRGVVDQYVIE